MSPDLLPVLHLRRQSAARGWRYVRPSAQRPVDRRWTLTDRGDGGSVRYTCFGDPSGPNFFDEVDVDTPNGRLRGRYLCAPARVLRAYLGWPQPDADPMPWPPRSTALVPTGLYARAGAGS